MERASLPRFMVLSVRGEMEERVREDETHVEVCSGGRTSPLFLCVCMDKHDDPSPNALFRLRGW